MPTVEAPAKAGVPSRTGECDETEQLSNNDQRYRQRQRDRSGKDW